MLHEETLFGHGVKMNNTFITCPKCGHTEPDFDGLELLHCPACGYCVHPNSTMEDGREICDFCSRELRQVRLNDHLIKTIEMDGQKVLSVKNPWAYLIIHYGKNIENRTRPTKYRGPLLIHASAKSDLGSYSDIWTNPDVQKIWKEINHLKTDIEKTNGHIIGIVDLVNCTPGTVNNFQRYTKSVWAEVESPYHLEKPFPFVAPLKAKGMLGVWTYADPTGK